MAKKQTKKASKKKTPVNKVIKKSAPKSSQKKSESKSRSVTPTKAEKSKSVTPTQQDTVADQQQDKTPVKATSSKQGKAKGKPAPIKRTKTIKESVKNAQETTTKSAGKRKLPRNNRKAKKTKFTAKKKGKK